jgi:hypothetical protein
MTKNGHFGCVYLFTVAQRSRFIIPHIYLCSKTWFGIHTWLPDSIFWYKKFRVGYISELKMLVHLCPYVLGPFGIFCNFWKWKLARSASFFSFIEPCWTARGSHMTWSHDQRFRKRFRFYKVELWQNYVGQHTTTRPAGIGKRGQPSLLLGVEVVAICRGCECLTCAFVTCKLWNVFLPQSPMWPLNVLRIQVHCDLWTLLFTFYILHCGLWTFYASNSLSPFYSFKPTVSCEHCFFVSPKKRSSEDEKKMWRENP